MFVLSNSHHVHVCTLTKNVSEMTPLDRVPVPAGMAGMSERGGEKQEKELPVTLAVAAVIWGEEEEGDWNLKRHW